ncbi:MAG: hypothetical protein H7249_15595 [Chitinophagaceae bacterium]|nr:hypothetical protein [Oligoflexus sp.]
MSQPSYPHTQELPHGKFRAYNLSDETPRRTGADMAATDMESVDHDMAPSDEAPPESHANLSDAGQAERPDTTAVNKDSVIRKENEPGPGVPH